MSDNYASFIEEAFINPIRSVLIVDDQYPTIDEIIAEAAGEGEAKVAWKKKIDEVKKVVAEFRGSGRPYLLDIHDTYPSAKIAAAKSEEAAKADVEKQEREVAGHLHQTDLLVLDYNLEPTKDDDGDGSLAISIARKILQNAHFNLCIVHTSKALTEAFPNMLLGLLSPIPDLVDIDEWKEASKRLEGSPDFDLELEIDIGTDLERIVGGGTYFRLQELYIQNSRDRDRAFSLLREDGKIWPRLEQVLNRHKAPENDWATFFFGAVDEYQCKLKEELCPHDLRIAAWSNGAKGTPPWIRSEFGFLAFTNKDDGPLLGKLKEALVAWSPRPSRLLTTVVRSVVDEHGIEVQDRSLGDSLAAALWYQRLLKEGAPKRDHLIDETVRRHTEQLLEEILPKVSEFMGKLIESEIDNLSRDCKINDAESGERDPIKDGAFKKLVLDRYNIDLSDDVRYKKSIFDHNVFVCSKPVSGWHLQTGHVLRIDGQLWCCLTPACDLVPGQKKSKSPDNFQNLRRFTAVLLEDGVSTTALKNAEDGHYIFLNINAEKVAHRIVEKSGQNPQWATFYAGNDGILATEIDKGTRSDRIFIHRLEPKAGENENDGDSFQLVEHESQIVAQLRYEYALNLLQTLGGSVMRVGLDFMKP